VPKYIICPQHSLQVRANSFDGVDSLVMPLGSHNLTATAAQSPPTRPVISPQRRHDGEGDGAMWRPKSADGRAANILT